MDLERYSAWGTDLRAARGACRTCTWLWAKRRPGHRGAFGGDRARRARRHIGRDRGAGECKSQRSGQERRAGQDESVARSTARPCGAREQQAIDAVKRFRDAVAEEPKLKNNAELEELRKRLLKEPLEFFRSLREQLQADHDTRPEALARLAGAAFELGKLTNEIGDKQDALRDYQEARAIRERLARENPAVTEFQSDLAASHNNIGSGAQRDRQAGRGAGGL